MNPKLAPKLTNDAPDDFVNKYVFKTLESSMHVVANRLIEKASQTRN